MQMLKKPNSRIPAMVFVKNCVSALRTIQLVNPVFFVGDVCVFFFTEWAFDGFV
jgi:hypothetical protein